MSQEENLSDKELEIKLMLERFETAMPEVHRQVKVYETNKANGTLKPLPTHNPLF